MSDLDANLLQRQADLREAKNSSENKNGDSDSNSFRELRQSAKLQQQGVEEKKTNSVTGKATARWLRIAWMNIVLSGGLSLIYINIHCFFAHLLGSSFFCKFGEEWFSQIPGGSSLSGIDKNKMKMLRMKEIYLLIFLDLLFVLLILAFIGVIFLLFDAVYHWYNWLWSGVRSLFGL